MLRVGLYSFLNKATNQFVEINFKKGKKNSAIIIDTPEGMNLQQLSC
jgi:hypothetical protein